MNKSMCKQQGMTLLELMVASALLAVILIMTQQSISTAQRSGEIVEARSQALRDLDRVWILLENDLRNVVAYEKKVQYSDPLPSMQIDGTEDYRLTFLRAGMANPLMLPRTEVMRVGYRLDDETLWRDSWIDPFNPDEEAARQQQLLEGIESLLIEAIPTAKQGGRSVTQGPWLETWPKDKNSGAVLPLAIRVTMELKNRGELVRFFTLAPGV